MPQVRGHEWATRSERATRRPLQFPIINKLSDDISQKDRTHHIRLVGLHRHAIVLDQKLKCFSVACSCDLIQTVSIGLGGLVVEDLKRT
jgi:hypothetical protein